MFDERGFGSLAQDHVRPHIPYMKLFEAIRRINANEIVRLMQLVLGCLLIICAPIISPLPGPGGIVFFGLGLGLVLRNSAWAKRRYVAFKRKRPQMGIWADWGLRRKSAKRRDTRAKQSKQTGN
jgi:hypothetical protein